MFRISVMSIFLFSLLVAAHLANAQQDYVDQLIKLTELSDSQQYREAINGYKRLESQAGAPDWLKAGAEYEIAELYGELNETDSAITALNNAVQLGFDDCLTPRASKRLATISKNPKATQVLAAMKITEGDFRELVWLKSEVEHAEHDARMMITDNINRVDQQSTDPSSRTANAVDPFGGSFVLASAATIDPKSAKTICEEVGRGAHGACGNNGSHQWCIPVSSARIRSSGASER
jgi:hypothetical protein